MLVGGLAVDDQIDVYGLTFRTNAVMLLEVARDPR